MTTKITILGGGAMATACAILLSENEGQRISLWARNPDYARTMSEQRENRRLLAGFPIPDQVEITADIDRAVAGTDLLVASIPTKALRSALTTLAPSLGSGLPVVSVVKGVENDTFLRPSQIITDVLGDCQVVALGGPSHAEEFARRKPASVVAACEDQELAKRVQRIFSTDRFRVYTNPDIIGVELGGALKNVVAIAAGICDGLEYGDNAKSALMTRGLVEMTRFGVEMGADPMTFSGLAGIGDLITTCVSPYGRNRKVGARLGQGETLDAILETTESVAEGVTTTKSIYDLAQAREIEMPICSEIYHVLFENKPSEDATASLMLRPHRGE